MVAFEQPPIDLVDLGLRELSVHDAGPRRLFGADESVDLLVGLAIRILLHDVEHRSDGQICIRDGISQIPISRVNREAHARIGRRPVVRDDDLEGLHGRSSSLSERTILMCISASRIASQYSGPLYLPPYSANCCRSSSSLSRRHLSGDHRMLSMRQTTTTALCVKHKIYAP